MSPVEVRFTTPLAIVTVEKFTVDLERRFNWLAVTVEVELATTVAAAISKSMPVKLVRVRLLEVMFTEAPFASLIAPLLAFTITSPVVEAEPNATLPFAVRLMLPEPVLTLVAAAMLSAPFVAVMLMIPAPLVVTFALRVKLSSAVRVMEPPAAVTELLMVKFSAAAVAPVLKVMLPAPVKLMDRSTEIDPVAETTKSPPVACNPWSELTCPIEIEPVVLK